MTSAEDIVARVDIKAHAKRLAKLIVPAHVKLLELSWNAERERLPVLGSFDLKNPAVQKTIKTLGKRITGISEHSRDEVRSMLEQAIAGAGKIPGTDEIARRFREISELAPKDDTPEEKRRAARRARTVARSETAVAFNTGAITAYASAGVTHVEVLDGDGDEDCAAADGQTWTLEEAQENPIAHPNCTRAFVPIVK